MSVVVWCARSQYTNWGREQLKKDGNLRDDIPIPEFDSEGNLLSRPSVPPKIAKQLKEKEMELERKEE